MDANTLLRRMKAAFAALVGEVLRGQELQGDESPQTGVPGPVDHSHAARAELVAYPAMV
jgi:hypothetical protein